MQLELPHLLRYSLEELSSCLSELGRPQSIVLFGLEEEASL
jgi:hypothetical protein